MCGATDDGHQGVFHDGRRLLGDEHARSGAAGCCRKRQPHGIRSRSIPDDTVGVMKTFMVAAIIALLIEPSYGQKMPPVGFPVGGNKAPKELSPEQEKAYKSSIDKVPNKKVDDPWQGVRPSSTAPSSKKAN